MSVEDPRPELDTVNAILADQSDHGEAKGTSRRGYDRVPTFRVLWIYGQHVRSSHYGAGVDFFPRLRLLNSPPSYGTPGPSAIAS